MCVCVYVRTCTEVTIFSEIVSYKYTHCLKQNLKLWNRIVITDLNTI